MKSLLKNIGVVLSVSLLFGGMGCHYMRGSRDSGASTGGRAGSGRSGSGPALILLSETTASFTPWGGIARSSKYIHLSDPAGILTSNLELKSDSFAGAVAISPDQAGEAP